MSMRSVLQFDSNIGASLEDGYDVFLGQMSAARTLTLPNVYTSDGVDLHVINSPGSTGDLTIQGYGAQLVSGSYTKVLAPGQSCGLVSYAANWYLC